MLCQNCGKAELVARPKTWVTVAGNSSITTSVSMLQCPSCGVSRLREEDAAWLRGWWPQAHDSTAVEAT